MRAVGSDALTLARPGDIPFTDALQAAIDHAYRAFAPYHARFAANVCTCPSCFTEIDRERLLKLPLRQIDGGLLDQYSWSAHGQDDDGPLSDDLRYLLPRYFELFALNDPKLHSTPECNLMQLGRTAYRNAWPTMEVAVIDQYADALLIACLANGAVETGSTGRKRPAYRCALRLDEVLGMLICAGIDITRMLEVWDTAPDPAAALHMANQRFDLVTDGIETKIRNEHLNSDFTNAARAAGAFVTSAKATRRIEAAFFQTDDPAAQQLLSDALLLA